jgi:hypothetical protein
LVVKGSDGMSGNQTTLAAIVGAIGLDPVALANMDGKAQAAAVQKALGLDFSDLEKERAKVYQDRTVLNARIRDDEALFRAFEIAEGTPDDLVDVLALTRDLDNIRDVIQANDQERQELATARTRLAQDREAVTEYLNRMAQIDDQITGLLKQIKALEDSKEKVRIGMDTLSRELTDRDEDLEAQATDVQNLRDPDPEPIREKIRNAEATNDAVRKKQTKANLEKNLMASCAKADGMTDRIMAIDQVKAERIAAAGLPQGLEKIGFDPDKGLTFEGFALKDLSTATRLRVATQIVLAMNQKRTGRPLNVILIKAGNDLDDDNRKTIVETAAEAGAQVWIELVRKPDSDDGLVVDVADGEAFFGVEPEQAKAADAPEVTKEAAQAVATARNEPTPDKDMDDAIERTRARLAAKKAERAAKKAPTAADTAREELVKSGRPEGKLF